MPLLMLANDATATRRRVYFQLVDATDYVTPETGEAGGQPQISVDGGSWTNTGIGVLVDIGNGRYYAVLTQTIIMAAGTNIQTRYKSANTAECPGDSVQVVGFDPFDDTALGLTNLDAAISGRSSHSAADVAALLPSAADVTADLLDDVDGVESTISVRKALRAILSVLVGKVSGVETNTPAFRDVGDTTNRVSATTDADGNRTAVTLDLED